MEAQDILQDIFFVLLYGGVIMLSLAAALYLLLGRGNAIAPEVKSPVILRRWAAAFLAGIAFSHGAWLFYAFHPLLAVYVIAFSLDLLLLFPTITGVLLSMMQDRRRPVWPFLALLAPAFVLLAITLVRGDEAMYTPVSIYLIALYALLMLFIFFAILHYERWLKDNYADLEKKEVWQSFLMLVCFLLFFVLYSSTAGDSHFLAYLLQIDCLILVALLIWRVETIQQLSENSSPETEPKEEGQKVSAPTDIPANIGPLLKKHCEKGQLYLQHDLSLAQLANAIGTNRTYLSQHFAQQGLTYNAYINGLRIRHFIGLYRKAVADGREFTAQQLAFESGYHSYSTFSTAFKQFTGKTVTAWMRDAAE